jgi:hypothetical protein
MSIYNPVTATPLADADVTVDPNADVASEYVCPSGTLSTSRTVTLDGTSLGDKYVVRVILESGNPFGSLIVKNTAGATLATLGGGGPPQTASFFVSSGLFLLLSTYAASVIDSATTTTPGLLSAADKVRLNDAFLQLTGRAGGQTATGGTAASEILTLVSTAHGTKGRILFGSSANFFDETAPNTTSWFTMGNSSTSPPGSIAQFNRNVNSANFLNISNPNTGTAAEAGLILSQSATTYTSYLYVSQLSTGFTTNGPFIAGAAAYEHTSLTGSHMFFSAFGTQDIDFYTTASRTLRLKIATGGAVSIADLGTPGGYVKAAGTSGLLSSVATVAVADVGNLSKVYRPLQGTALTNADQTLQPFTDKVSEYVQTAALTVSRTKTLGTTTVVTGTLVRIVREDTAAFTLVVANGGGAGGTLFTFAASPTEKQAATFFYNGTDWVLVGFEYLTVV